MRIFDYGCVKKGSLQLSINAIVILIMAMVVLGLGLGFIRNLFDRGETNLIKVIDNNQLKNKATYNEPFTLDSKISLKQGASSYILVGVFNKDTSSKTISVKLTGCKNKNGNPINTNANTGSNVGTGGSNDNADASLDIVFPGEITLKSNEATGFQGLVSVGKAIPTGSYLCTIEVQDETNGASREVLYTGSLVVEVTG